MIIFVSKTRMVDIYSNRTRLDRTHHYSLDIEEFYLSSLFPF